LEAGAANKGHFAMKRARAIDLPLPAHRCALRRPLWRSLANALAWQMDLGHLPGGRRVPSTRTLARELGLSRTTVTLAYDLLVADGYLESRTGDGTYVLGHAYRSTRAMWLRPKRWLHAPDGLPVFVSGR
jgi:DNA-binding transcriptional MocR family regulator